MYAGATLFLDVSVQPDLWPDGAWPLMRAEQVRNVERLFALAGESAVRQGGMMCRHDAAETDAGRASGIPAHCGSLDASSARPPGCEPRLPLRIARGDRDGEAPDRTVAIYLDSGCRRPPDAAPVHRRAFDCLIAGVRDAVVFGAGVEYGLDLAIAALLRRRVRTHVVLDAVGAADESAAQLVVARWKRAGADGLTVAVVERLLAASAIERR